MSSQDWVLAGIDVDRPNAARVYDYYLGGAHNFAADRRVAEQMYAIYPETPLIAQANRAFLRRAVKFLADAGVRQFLDIGSGIPTVGHVHEIAQAVEPDARVVYVDIDPLAVAHSREILAGNERAAVIREDLLRPERILAHPAVRRLFDFTQPVAVLVVALLHFIPDNDDPTGLVARLTEPLAAGSHLVVSHLTEDLVDPMIEDDVRNGIAVYRRAGIGLTPRSRQQVAALFNGFQLLEPGITRLSQWRPEFPGALEEVHELSTMYAGVGRKGPPRS